MTSFWWKLAANRGFQPDDEGKQRATTSYRKLLGTQSRNDYSSLVPSILSHVTSPNTPYYNKSMPSQSQQNAESPAFLRMSTTDLKANHSGISSPARKRLRNSVPDSLTIFAPCFFALLSSM
mmetsp:Transcript_37443/g.59997  ORF Transcript_37443/g.59997 Transcript_37443/m.59997 type:complete len:122 (+) Transcript_37443:145-510(+)